VIYVICAGPSVLDTGLKVFAVEETDQRKIVALYNYEISFQGLLKTFNEQHSAHSVPNLRL
jgi:hypothetical protein